MLPSTQKTAVVRLAVGDEAISVRIRRRLEPEGLRCVEDLAVRDTTTPEPSRDPIVILLRGPQAQRLREIEAVRAANPDTPIVGVWSQSERAVDGRALKKGLDAVIPEAGLESMLAPAVSAVCHGLVCLPGRDPDAEVVGRLSDREKQVLGMLVLGFTNAEIGQRLYLAESTVKSHLSSAYMKLGVRSRKDAAALILNPHDGLGPEVLALSSR